MRHQLAAQPVRWVMTLFIGLLLFSSSALAQQAAKREINGTVVDVDGKPVANASVAITGGGPTATTGADGTFKLANVATTNLTLEVSAEGFSPRQATILAAKTALQMQLVLVKPAAPPAPETRMVAGVVTDGNRAPLAGVVVKVRGTDLSAVSAADGTFSIPGVAKAEVVLELAAPGQPETTLNVAADKSTVVAQIGQATQGGPLPPANRTVRGKVVDPVSGEGVTAAQVTVKTTGQVIFTEADGAFVIENVPPGMLVIEIEAPEHETRVLEVPETQTTLNVPLAMVQGEQIVIEGRAPAIVKTNLANGASVIDDKSLNRVSAQNIDSAMQGKLSGANLQFNSGAPGGGAQLRLRGISTINGQSSPLYVIDGVVVSNVSVPNGQNAVTAAAAGGSSSNQDNPVNRIADLNPNDIETVEVLKGASAAALYGSKAANGVVIITTKRGRQGENHVEVTQRIGFSQVSNRLGSRTFHDVEEVKAAFGGTSPLVDVFMNSNGQTYDHEAAIERTPIGYETIASASGGTDKGNYYGSVLVRNDPGVVIGTFYNKQSGRLSLGYTLGERFHLGLTANLIHSTSDRGLTNNDNTNTSYYVALSETPSFVNLKPTNGLYPANPAIPQGTNPEQSVTLFQNREDVWRLIGGTTASLDAYSSHDGTSKVKVLGNFGADSFQQKNNILSPNQLLFEPADGLAGTSIDASTSNLNYNVGAGVVWQLNPKDKKFRNALSGGLTYESVDLNSVYVIAQNLNGGQSNVGSGTALNVNQNRLRTKDSGVYLQDEIALLDDRLSVLGGLLGERSSLNGDTGKYFLYPKVAAVYSLLAPPKEGEAKGPFETLRVRGAFGQAGNRPNYGQKFTALDATNTINGNGGVVLLGSAGDANIEPERQTEIELGADLATKDNKIVTELTFYNRSISNLLLQRSLSTSTGFTTEFLNGGGMRNTGIEAAVQVSPLNSKVVDWTSRATLTLNRSKITDLPANIPYFDITAAGFGTGLGAFRIEKGKSATQIVGPAGKDADGNQIIAAIGNGEPDFRVGWSNVAKTGDWTFGMLLDWQQGSDIVNLTRFLYDANNTSPDAAAAAMRKAARKAGDYPYLEDASFVKLRELSVAYTVPKKIASQLGPLKTLTVSASGRNLLTFTGYSGLDPEVSNFGSQPIGRNYDVAPYPPSRSFWFSVTAGL